jgi:hypothetical protein
MPGVYRPYTWVDILGSLNGQNSSTADTSTTGVGAIAEVDETLVIADSATTLVAAPAGWDMQVWGAISPWN